RDRAAPVVLEDLAHGEVLVLPALASHGKGGRIEAGHRPCGMARTSGKLAVAAPQHTAAAPAGCTAAANRQESRRGPSAARPPDVARRAGGGAVPNRAERELRFERRMTDAEAMMWNVEK